MFQEMLKAVKSQEAAAAAAAAGVTNHDVTSSSASSSDSPTPAGGKLGSSPSPNPASDQLPTGEEMRSGLIAAKSSKVIGQVTSTSRPGNERGTQKERRINLGTKAADLFAKLQQRLSANKS